MTDLATLHAIFNALDERTPRVLNVGFPCCLGHVEVHSLPHGLVVQAGPGGKLLYPWIYFVS